MSTQFFIFFSLIIFYGLVIWFLHKASVYFHKMDVKVGNTEKAEIICFCNDSLIAGNDILGQGRKEKEERERKEKEEIFLGVTVS